MLSKIKTITPDGSFSTQHGTFFSFKYSFEDGETISANHKTDASPFNVGDEVEYNVTKENEYGKKGKVSKPGESFPASNGKAFKGKGGNNRSFALSYAKDIAVAIIRDGKSISDKDILSTADKFVKWLDGEEEEKGSFVKLEESKEKVSDDSLPF